jgi:putative Holliday junction resolvase
VARILSLDYGIKRTGIAVSDPEQRIATGLAGVQTAELFAFLERYLQRETVSLFLVGYPLDHNNRPTHATAAVDAFLLELAKRWPAIPRQTVDERFSSRDAARALVQSGVKKMARRNKHLLDEVSATVLLQEYLYNRPE